MQEIFDIYSSERQLIGKTCYRGDELPIGEYHLAVIAIIINSKNQLLMTKRSKEKKLAGLWECTAGSVLAGETSYKGILREIKEEIGIEISNKQEEMIHSFIDDDAIFDVWLFEQDIEINNTKLQLDEVDEIKYVSKYEIKELIRENKIVPNLVFIDSFIEKNIIKVS